ncbi:MAG TPA: ribosome biogenesis GTPase Der [Thermoanaerobaculia bacterium]|nr:ribosome biogenesis GTPase Der [Thermoanaerobaculia bacterium]
MSDATPSAAGEGAAPSAAPTPVVAIVGRPNVGKSTLFNRLLGRRVAIVHDTPGVTRDRITGRCDIGADQYVELVDTGGLVPGDDPLGLNEQVGLAVAESDVLVLVVDGKVGLVPADQTVWEAFRASGKPAVLAVNKADTRAAQEAFDEFYALGVGPQVLVSGEHGFGIPDLLEELRALLPVPPAPAVEERIPALAIVGRPNVGKSSLLNRLVGEERTLVSPMAGTTRDPIDTRLVRADGEDLLLIDTAGIRRRSQASDAPEELAVMMAKRQIERADVAALVIDAEAGVTSGDLAVAGSIWELGRAAVVVVNKWDLLDDPARERLETSFERLDELLCRPPRINVSALSGRGVQKVLPAVDTQLVRFQVRVATAELNRLLERATQRHHAPARHGHAWKLYYATQVSSGPPTFMVFANRALPRQDAYRRYLENSLRAELDLPGVPLRLVVRQRAEKGPEKGASRRGSRSPRRERS